MKSLLLVHHDEDAFSKMNEISGPPTEECLMIRKGPASILNKLPCGSRIRNTWWQSDNERVFPYVDFTSPSSTNKENPDKSIF